MKWFKIVYKTLLIIIWFIIIFLFSSQKGTVSTEITNVFLERMLWFVDNDITFIVIRKIAHISEFLILGILVYNLMKEFTLKQVVLYSFMICTIFACFDELHQLFVGGRDGKILDVFIDSIGITIGILIMNKFNKNLSK